MVHRREGTAAGILLLQRNSGDDRKNALSPNRNNHENSALLSPADNPESGLPQISDESSSVNLSTKSSRSTPSTPTRKNRKISQDRSTKPPTTPATPAKRALFKRDSGIHSATDTNESASLSTPPGENNGVFPKPLRSGLLRASRLQSTSLIEVSAAARKRGRRKTICNSLEDFSFIEPLATTTPLSLPDKWTSADSLVRELNPFALEKLTCSVPLDKLSLGTVKSIMSTSNGSLAATGTTPLRTHSSDTDLTRDFNTPTNYIVGLSSPQTTAKLLCLYCDKKFTSQKLLCKHTERVHATDGRRLSSRNSIASLSWPSIVAYPGCCYCGNGGGGHKLANSAVTGAVTDDLKALFHHFLDVHSDKYYACRPCELRFPNVEGLNEHVDKKHSESTESSKAEKVTTPGKPSAKRATAGSTAASLDDLTQPLHVNVDSTERISPGDENESATSFTEKIYSRKTRRQLKQQAMQTRTTLVTRSCHNLLRNNEDTILTRLGVVQNRLPRGRKGTRNRRVNHSEVAKSEQSPITVPKGRSKVGRVGTSSMKDSGDSLPNKGASNARAEPLNCTFEDDFYETVSHNVRENLSCHLDGTLEDGPSSRSPLSPTAAVPAIRSTVVRSPLISDSEIHEATALAAVTAFPTLLTAEQYGSDWIAERKIKRPITKNSWKWKWDCVKKYKFVNEGGKIVKKIKQPVLGMRDLSKLDMWTQLAMRTKHEIVQKQNVELAGTTDILGVGEVAREEKRKQIAQLNSILDSRVFPQIMLEQSEQSLVKSESNKQSIAMDVDSCETSMPETTPDETQIPQILQLRRRSQPHDQDTAPILSGEWARPRCYICFSCGGRFDKLKTLEEHKVSRHPYILTTHYELVGRELTAGDLYQHLHIPVKALHRHLEHKQSTKYIKSEGELSNGNNGANGEEESMDSINSLSASTTSANGNTTVASLSTISSLEEHLLAAEAATVHVARRCSKCKKMCNGKLELYRHMLNCSGDYAWRIAQKRKYRYFGVKSRRHARHNFQRIQRRKVVAKKEENDADGVGASEKSPKGNVVRSRPSDADTIRRMLENLPAKRACRQIIPNVTKPRSKKFTKNLGLKKLVNATCVKKVKGKAMTVASTTLTAISSNMRRKQRIIARQITRHSGRMAMRLRELKQNNSNASGKSSTGAQNDTATKKSTPNTPQKPSTKQQQQSQQPVPKSPQILDKTSAGEKKPGKRSKKMESVQDSADVVDAPEIADAAEKTPKKRTPIKRNQDKTPKDNDESPKQTDQVKTPKQSPRRDAAPTVVSHSEPSTSKTMSPTEPLNLVVPTTQLRSHLLQVSPVNKRQRGKKLTDCIAKLQEKLGKPFFEGNENLDKVLSTRQQTPPQDASSADAPSVLISPESLSTSRTPKRKTVTRKIIQKSKSDTFVAPKPALLPPAIKIECEDDMQIAATKSTSKEDNISMTSDMYDSLVESDRCDAPAVATPVAPKDNTLNEFNDSAVSSMSTDSVLMQNSTPVKSSSHGSLHEFFPVHSAEPCVRKSARNSEKILSNFQTAAENPPVPVINFFRPFADKPTTRKCRSGKSPPDVVTSFETPPMLEEALNLTVAKTRSSLTTAKTSPPRTVEKPLEHIFFPTVTYVETNDPMPQNVPGEDKTNLETSASISDTVPDIISNAVANDEKTKPKSKKTLPNLNAVEPMPVSVNEADRAPANPQVEPVKAPAARKGRGGSKLMKKSKAQLSEHLTQEIVPSEKPPNPIDQSTNVIATVVDAKITDAKQTIELSPNSQSVDTAAKKKRGRRPRKQETSADFSNSVDIESLIPKHVATATAESVILKDSSPKESIEVAKVTKTPKRVAKASEGNVVPENKPLEAIEVSKVTKTTKHEAKASEESVFSKDNPKESIEVAKATKVPKHEAKTGEVNVVPENKPMEAIEVSEVTKMSKHEAKASEESVVLKDDLNEAIELPKVTKTPKHVLKASVGKSENKPKDIQVPKVTKRMPKRGRKNAKQTVIDGGNHNISPEDEPVVPEKEKPNETEKVVDVVKPDYISKSPAIEKKNDETDAQVSVLDSSLPLTESSLVAESSQVKGRPKRSAKKATPKTCLPKEVEVPGKGLAEPKPIESNLDKSSEKSCDKLPNNELNDNKTSPLNQKLENPTPVDKKPESNAREEPVQNQKPSIDEQIPSTSQKAEEKSIFDTLREVQENIYFRPHEDASLTRKYTRKGSVPLAKKMPPKFTTPADIASTSSSAASNDMFAKITLNDGKHLVTSWTASMELRDEPQPSTSRSAYQSPAKSIETPAKPLNKRRSNRNRNNLSALPDNSSICKELDEIVASFLEDDESDETANLKVSDECSGPTRFSNAESVVSPVSKTPLTVAASTGETSKDITDSPVSKPQELQPEHMIICKELSVTLTKMSEDEIEAQRKITIAKNQENVVEIPEVEPATVVEAGPITNQMPKRTRSRRQSVKPENVSLTDTSNEVKIDESKSETSSDDKISLRKSFRKRKSIPLTNPEELARNGDKKKELRDPEPPATILEPSKDEVRTIEHSPTPLEPCKDEGRTRKQNKKDTEIPDETLVAAAKETPAGPENQKSPADETNQKRTPPVRRRRKNELAAIVADQLLESFKEVDKSRIDELKKLENLAYEKSDDLYITGIRLTPLTKRKIVMAEQKEESHSPKERPKPKQKRKKNANDSAKESDTERPTVRPQNSVVNHVADKTGKDKSKNSHENLFRNFADAQETPKLNADAMLGTRNFNLTFGTFRSYTAQQEYAFGSQKDATLKAQFIPGSADTSCSGDSHGNRMQEDSLKAPNETSNSKSSTHRKMKKKMNRLKKERKAENENISELRSGLESFTFGKNTFQQFGKGLFGSRGFIGLFSSGNKETGVPSFGASNSMPAIRAADNAESKDTNSADRREDESRKPLLRPSLLSSVLTKETTTNKKPSRDPRLNKSKSTPSEEVGDEEIPTEFVKRHGKSKTTTDSDESFVKPKVRGGLRASKRATRSTPTPKVIADINDDDDDDNCLAAIAQSVNNRICEDEEFSQTDEFDAALPTEATSSQTLSATPNHAHPPMLDDQRTMDVPIEDENTNTELIDMDLEDDMSMYTSFSQDVSSMSRSRFGQKRRRRRSILLARRPKKIPDPTLPDVSFDCAICNKTFAKAAALAKHQQTFTHVQKLSEYEYLNKVNEPKKKESKIEVPEPKAKTVAPSRSKSPVVEAEKSDDEEESEEEPEPATQEEEISATNEEEPDIPQVELPSEPLDSDPTSVQANVKSPEVMSAKVGLVLPGEIEPISSPEPAEATYDRFHNATSRIALSQEERLFYECCNMLKGSETPMVERSYPIVPPTYTAYDVPNKPVTPKSSERFSYMGSEVSGNFQHGTAYTVKSPMSQSRTSPRYAYPKIDVNQFSDISSDSNPAFTQAQHPHLALQPSTECHPVEDATPTASKLPFYDRPSTRPTYAEEPVRQHGQDYHQSDEGAAYYGGHEEGIPQVSDAGRGLTARTYVGDQRNGKPGNVVTNMTAGYSVVETDRSRMPLGNEQPLTSPLHSNSSEGSNTNITACRMRTKAAMKGYDNFKVSIPTVGLDIQQALERSPHGGCKLTALAEIALGSEAPITPPRYHQLPTTPGTPVQDECYEKHESSQQQQQQKTKPDINEKFAKKYQELIMNNIKPAATKTAKKKEVCDNIGNKLGYKAKRGKSANKPSAAANEIEAGRQTDNNRAAVVIEKPPKDIYEFDESQEAMDKDTGRGSPSKGRSTIVIPERPFKNIGSEEQNTIKFHKPDEVVVPNEEESQMSTTSYSDRDDFNYGSMSEGDGEDSDMKDEEDLNSSDSDSCASAQTAKTHKCLIMGRIFGNANKHRPVENVEKPPPPAPEPKKKIPSQELNEMFDRLRKDGGKSGEEKLDTKSQSTEVLDKKDTGKSNSGKAIKGGKTTSTDKAKRQSSGNKGGKSAPSDPPPKTRESQRSSRSAAAAAAAAAESDFPREISKLQAELGMTAEEIAELIGEGKRKSQRKCAINRPRTVVDTWSSDEYEDFLSTKDVIAFIEEKEKRSKKKKTMPPNKPEKQMAELSKPDPKESSKENEHDSSANQVNEKPVKEKGEKVATTTQVKKPQRVVERLMQRFNKNKGANTKKKDVKSAASSVSSKSDMTEKPPSSDMQPPEDLSKESPTDNSTNQKKQPTLSVKPRIKSRHHTDNESESDFENELRRRKSSSAKRTTTSKISKRRKTIAFKEEHNDHTSDSKPVPKPKQSANLKTSLEQAAAPSDANKTTSTPVQSSPSTIRPLARRKRIASEMLYYWSSSSSDEEFGRIETNEDDLTQKDEYLPKHGWIVGDSHKKLVTLLATAKGKKMTDIKEPGGKKK